MADIIRCNWCENIALDNPDSDHCPNCGRNDYIMDLDGTEEFNDTQLKQLWLIFGDLPMNPETEEMEDQFLYFPVGTHKEEIWHWFDKRCSKGVYGLLYEFDEIQGGSIMFSLDWWESHFCQWFEVNHLMLDLMHDIGEDQLYTFITNKVANEFTAEELKEKLKNELTIKEIDNIISDLGL